MTRIAIRSAPALRGGVAPVTTFVGLLVTAWISRGLKITGASTWCWPRSSLAGWLAGLILPVFLMRKAVDQRKT
jgi:hypothetical protein